MSLKKISSMANWFSIIFLTYCIVSIFSEANVRAKGNPLSKNSKEFLNPIDNFLEGHVDRGMNVCRDEDFYTPQTSVTPSENIIPREKIPGEEKRLPSSISLKLSPDTTYQGQMMTMRIDLHNNSDSSLTIFKNKLYQEIKNKQTGDTFVYEFFGFGDHGSEIAPSKYYTISRIPQQYFKPGLSELKQQYSNWNYWPEGEYSYCVKYIFGTSEAVSNTIDFIIKPIPENEREAFNKLILISEQDIFPDFDPITGYNEKLEKNCEKFKNSMYIKEYHRILLSHYYYSIFLNSKNTSFRGEEYGINKLFEFVKNYPNDEFSLSILRGLTYKFNDKEEADILVKGLLSIDNLLFYDIIYSMKK